MADLIGTVAALVALGAITGFAVSGQGPFGSQSQGAPPANVRPYVTPMGGDEGSDADTQAGTGSGTSCAEWDERLDEERRYSMSQEFLTLFQNAEGTEPAAPPGEDANLMMGILDAMCAEPGNAGQTVEALASLVWMSEALED